jgi:hypothetical protein
MDDLTAQTRENTLPELVRFMLEHLRNLRLKGPSTLQQEHYAKVWQSLATAGNKLIERIDDLRFHGFERWETGDEASVKLFGRLGVPKSKEVLQNLMRELASLGTKWHVSSTLASIDTQPFDPDQVPRLVELEAAVEDVKMEDVKQEDVKQEDVKQEDVKQEDVKQEDVKQEDVKQEDVKQEDVKQEYIKQEDVTEDAVTNETVKMEAIKNEVIEPSLSGPVLPSIESKSTYPFAS